MKKEKFTVEIGFYVIFFLLALMLRIINIGISPLSEVEATNAINALNIADGQFIMVGDNFLYMLFTSVLFYVGKSTEFTARLIPAIIGSLIVFVPFFFRHRLGKRLSIILAFCFTFDAGLIAISRQASSEMLSIIFLLFTAGFFNLRREVPAGIFSALALLSGSGFWYGIFVFGLYYAGLRVAVKTGLIRNKVDDVYEIEKLTWEWKNFLIAFVVTAMLCSTLFMVYPQGINGLISGFTSFISQSFSPSNVQLSTLLPIMLSFEIFPIIMGLNGLVLMIVRKQKIDLRLIILFIAAVLPVLIIPGRQIHNLLWVNMSFWLLGVHAFDNLPNYEKGDRIPLFGLGLLNVIAIIFGWMNLTGLFIAESPTDHDFQLRILSVIGAVVLVLLAFILVAWGWSIKVGLLAFFYSFFIMLLFYNTSSIFRISGLGSIQKSEVWSTSGFVDSTLFRSTLNDYSEWNIGFATSPEIVVNKISDNIMRWALRDFENVSYVVVLPIEQEPEMIITPVEIGVTLDELYTGQDFIFSRNPRWRGMNTFQWVRWLIKHETVDDTKAIILWVRSDLFPGSESSALP